MASDDKSNELEAMTVNERLFEKNLLGEFYRAVESGNAEQMRVILQKVGIYDQSANDIIRKVLNYD